MDRPDGVVDLLHFLIRRMDTELEAGETRIEPPALLRLDGADVACAVDGIDLHVKPLHGHPAQVLAGCVAPLEWFAIGVLTGGWAHEPGRDRRRVRVTTLVCRDGNELTAVRAAGEELRFMDDLGEGLVLDTLRRVLELPTGPPGVSVEQWLASCWLAMIVTRSKRGKRAPKLTWREAAALHPAIDVVGARPDELPTVGPRTAAAMRWERFRRIEAARGDELAAWMDEGMFARAKVGAYPPLAELLARAGRRLTPDALARVETTLADWGLLDGASVA